MVWLARLHAVISRLVDGYEVLGCIHVLRISNARPTEEACGKHPDATREAHGNCAGLREALANHAEHCRPIERLTQSEDRGCDEDQCHGSHGAQQVKPNRAEAGGDEQQPQRIDLVHDRSGEETKDEHQQRGIDE